MVFQSAIAPNLGLVTASAAAAGATLTIDLGAIRRNYRAIAARLKPGTVCSAVVKADSYGLGAARVAPMLADAGCRHFFVAHLGEAEAIRPLLPADCAIYVLHGLMPGAEAECLAVGATPVLNNLGQIERWAALAKREGRRLPAIVQIDSGMSRLGLPPEEIDRLAAEPERLSGIDLLYVMSHLACADEPDHPASKAQLAAFEARRRLLPAAPASLAASPGILLGPDYHFDLVRPGVALYGVSPVSGVPSPVEPVVRLEARVVQVREIGPGTGVGYGHTYIAERPMRIAAISVGYADGWIRHLGNRGAGYIGEHAAPFIGRISMDSATIDVSAIPGEIPDGTPVELIGAHRTVEEVAIDAATIGYEILTNLGTRFHRIYVDA